MPRDLAQGLLEQRAVLERVVLFVFCWVFVVVVVLWVVCGFFFGGTVVLHVLRIKSLVAEQTAVVQKEHLDAAQAVARDARDHVGVAALAAHVLSLLDAAQRRDLIAITRGRLEVERARRCAASKRDST